MRGKETVLVRRAQKVDKLRPAAAAAPEHPLEGCLVWPAASKEEGKGWIQIDGYDFLARPGADVVATDEVQVRGDWYQVEGKPADYGRRGVLVNARRTS